MRQSGVTGVLIYCANHHCGHVVAVSIAEWPNDVRLSDFEASTYVQSVVIAAQTFDPTGNPKSK
jgi:hypothetical protein